MKIKSIQLDKGANIFPEGALNFHCMTVAKTVSALAGHDLSGAVFIFNVNHAPNEQRAFNTFVKRCTKIAAGCGVQLSKPTVRVVQGFEFTGQFVMAVKN